MRDASEGGDERELLLAAVEAGSAAGSCADDGGTPLASAVARALAGLLHPCTTAQGDGAADGGWLAVLGGVHRRAVELARCHPASWTLATSSAVLVDDWVRGGTWASALRAALERSGARPTAVRDAPVVVVLHLFAVRPRAVEVPDAAQPSAALAAYPHVARLRALLSSDGPACEPGCPVPLAAVEAGVERLLR